MTGDAVGCIESEVKLVTTVHGIVLVLFPSDAVVPCMYQPVFLLEILTDSVAIRNCSVTRLVVQTWLATISCCWPYVAHMREGCAVADRLALHLGPINTCGSLKIPARLKAQPAAFKLFCYVASNAQQKSLI